MLLPVEPDSSSLRVQLLDMGRRKYGDCILCEYQGTSILIDGGHSSDYWPSDGVRSIPQQLAGMLGGGPPFHVSLLVVTHCHADHIGCLPRLVEAGELQADWALVADERLGFGHALDDQPEPDVPPAVAMMVAALREDTRADVEDDELLEFLQDAASLEARYKEMLQSLEGAGTRVVRYGRDSADALLDAFENVGLHILGPTQDHLLICAEAIRQFSQDATDELMAMEDADLGEDAILRTYRQMADSPAEDDAADMAGKGAALNDQSIVVILEVDGRKVLLPGDMQFAKAEVEGLDSHMQQLRQLVANEAPYDFVKIAHHSSYNGLDRSHFEELAGTPRLGHTGGSQAPSHPHGSVLSLLREHRDSIKFCRTDRNRLIDVRLSGGGVWIYKETGNLNDFSANSLDTGERPAPPTLVAAEVPATPSSAVVATAPSIVGQNVKITARIPHVATSVTLTVTVDPAVESRASRTRAEMAQPSPAPPDLPELRLAPGRTLPRLLFATSREALAANIGPVAADYVVETLRQSGHAVIDTLPPGAGVARTAAPLVRGELNRRADAGAPIQGVVILGGYDAVPAQRLDVLDADSRRDLDTYWDADNFIVWSDDIYGDMDGDELPEVPVSRVPDGGSAAFLIAALRAPTRSEDVGRFGIRNVARPFAEYVFRELPGTQRLFVSGPATWQAIPRQAARADVAYFMLHGADWDGTTFWGEDESGSPEAFSLELVPDAFAGTVLTGCCWGALCADRPAARVQPGQVVRGRGARDSIALSFLQAGATAFVGCTGSHYSPTEEPYGYYGHPMHRAFWTRYLGGTTPAKSLYDAKIEYLAGIPYYSDRPESVAIETKILRQFTCLGLGW